MKRLIVSLFVLTAVITGCYFDSGVDTYDLTTLGCQIVVVR